MKKVKIIGLVILGLIILIQVIPVNKTNPKITHQVSWDSKETKAMFDRACADCHSNETKWPWYSSVAPISFMIAKHVNDGREKFNISNGNLDEANEAAEKVEKGVMPLSTYLPLHPEAKLTAKEKETFINGLIKTFGAEEN